MRGTRSVPRMGVGLWSRTSAGAVPVGAKARSRARTPGRHLHTTGGDTTHCDSSRLLITGTLFSHDGLTTQHAVYRIGHVAMDDQLLPALLFDKYIKSWWCFTLQNTLLRMPPP